MKVARQVTRYFLHNNHQTQHVSIIEPFLSRITKFTRYSTTRFEDRCGLEWWIRCEHIVQSPIIWTTTLKLPNCCLMTNQWRDTTVLEVVPVGIAATIVLTNRQTWCLSNNSLCEHNSLHLSHSFLSSYYVALYVLEEDASSSTNSLCQGNFFSMARSSVLW